MIMSDSNNINTRSRMTIKDLTGAPQIECQLYTTKELVITLLITVPIFFICLIAGIKTGIDDWGVWVMVAAIGAFVALNIKMLLFAVRKISISDNEVLLIYPNETITIPLSQLTVVSVRRKKTKKGRIKGIVFFRDGAEKKRGISLNLGRPGGTEAFVWFERKKEQV
jgi:hypothetical protein